MNLTPHQKRQLRFVIVLVIGIPLTVFALYKGVQLLINASGDATPQEVVVSNLTTSSLTVSWVTEKAVDGYVIPVLNGTEQNPVLDKRGSGKRESHYVVLKSLEPSSEYSFILVSDNEKYTQGSSGTYKFTTAPIGEDTPVPNPVYGTVTGSNAQESIIYVMFKDKSVYPVSTDVPENGNWIVELSSFRSISDMGLIRTTDSTQLIVIARNGLNQAGVIEGSYSELFNKSGQLNSDLVLADVAVNEITSYFPNQTLLGNASVTPDPVPQPEPQAKPTPKPVPSVPISTKYIVRQDVPWEDLSNARVGTLDLTTGEDSVVIANLTDTNFVVAWRSREKEQGYIKYGLSKEVLDSEMKDSRDSLTVKGDYYSHYIESGRLKPDTTYYFEIYSGDSKYDNNGSKYTITTYSTLSSAPPLDTRGGTLINSSDPSDWVLVFQLIDNDGVGTSDSSGYIATIPDLDGSWILVVGDARSSDGSSYFTFSQDDILQASFLGAQGNTFDFNLGQNDIQLDVSKLGGGVRTRVDLLTDYGIVDLQ